MAILVEIGLFENVCVRERERVYVCAYICLSIYVYMSVTSRESLFGRFYYETLLIINEKLLKQAIPLQ